MPATSSLRGSRRKLDRHGVRKIIPDKETLAEAYRLFARGRHIEQIIERELKNADAGNVRVPAGLARQVRKALTENPKQRWDGAVREIAAHPPDVDPALLPPDADTEE